MARVSTGTMTVGIFAVLFGLVGAYALRASLAKPEPEPPPAPRTVNVPLAATPIAPGRKLTLSDMVLVPMTQDDMKARGYPLEQLMIDTNQIVGRYLKIDLKQGDPFFTTSLYAEGTGPKLADKLKPGMRAITIPIDNLAAVGGSTVEGSFVDVLFKARKREADRVAGKPAIPETTVTLLENVEVLSVGRSDPLAERGLQEGLDVRTLNNQNQRPTGIVSVTIAVTPDQANIVKAVLGQGDLSLSLRSDKGNGQVAPNKYTLEGILGLKNPEVAGLDRTEIFRDNQSRQFVEFENDRVIKNEISLVPGVSPALTFPVPPQVPTAPEKADGGKDATSKPTPMIREGYGGGYGYGYGAPYWNYGNYGLPYGR